MIEGKRNSEMEAAAIAIGEEFLIFSPSHSSRCSRDKRVLSMVFFEVAHWALTKLPAAQAQATKTGDVKGDHLVKL